MDTLKQIATEAFIICVGPLSFAVSAYFLMRHRKLNLVSLAASAGLMFFVTMSLVIITGDDPRLRPDKLESWLMPPVVGIIAFLIALPSMKIQAAIKGYKSVEDYFVAESQKSMQKIKALEQIRLRERLKDWFQQIRKEMDSL
ncbi:MAG: hypothetical protein HZB51_09115 [Chloroflexi bacterium]|nr:hypothetical protein [Chloroflexota bacterium]